MEFFKNFLGYVTSKEFIDFCINFSLGFIIAYFDRTIFCVQFIKKGIAEGKVSVVNGHVVVDEQSEQSEQEEKSNDDF